MQEKLTTGSGAAEAEMARGNDAPPAELARLGVSYEPPLDRDGAERILRRISQLKVGVIGDGCLDAYWHADMTISELSRETPHYPLPVVREAYSPGAAGNVAANLRALGCASVAFCTVIGDDWRGHMLRQCLGRLEIDDSHLLVADGWVTPAYCKPYRHGLQHASQEDPRLDFNNYAHLAEPSVRELLERLDRMAEQVAVIAVTDQLPYGVVGPQVRQRLAYWAAQGRTVVVDSRDRIGEYAGVILKPNEIEAQRWAAPERDSAGGSWADWLEAARKLAQAAGAPCCLTLGENGSLWVEGGHAVWVPSRRAEPPLDIVGAGDCFASGLACALGTGSSGAEAMAFAHIGASIVVRKLGMTGTASPEEILQAL